VVSGRACSLQILLVNDHNVVLLIHDLLLTLQLPTSRPSDSAAVTNELKIAKFIGDNVHVRQAVVIRTDKSVASQYTVAAWTSADDLCILYYCYYFLTLGKYNPEGV